MATFEFNPGVDSITLRIKCPHCGEEFLSDAMTVPSPDWEAETHGDSIESDEYEIQCEHCGECFNVSLYNGFYGGNGEVDIDDDCILEVIEEYPEEYEYDKELFDLSHADIEDIIEAIEPLSEPIKVKLYKLLYVQLIINLETYLGDTLKYHVLNNEIYLRKFVEGYTPYKKETFKFIDIYRQYDKIKDIANKTLMELLYHKLYLMKILYKAILNVDLGDISKLSCAIQIRHDIVHRDGKSTEGEVRVITKEQIEELANLTKDFIYNIDIQLPSEAVVSGMIGEDELF